METGPRNSRQSARTNASKKTASDVLDAEAEYDTDEFEELLDKMEPEEIKKLDQLSQALEGDDSGSSDDDLPLVPKRKVDNENYSSDDDLTFEPKSKSDTSTVNLEVAESSDEEADASSKKSLKKKSTVTPTKKLQETTTEVTDSST